ncbi:MAG: CoA-transferase [Alphaproteobacteria bacterium]|jgi:glutaconate CoA-transferase subunit B|nr:CoA-transferase [Alphaproteobacteria bacterium]
MTAAPATIHERLAVALARTFSDREVGFTGLATGRAAAVYITGIPLAAMALAQHTHAPNLTILLAGWSHNPDLEALHALPDLEFDERLRDLPCEAQAFDYPGQFSLKRGDVSFGFSSGVQVDSQGNLNGVCVGDHARPQVRLVGPILHPEHMTLFGREYVMMPHHERRNFVDKVDYISGVGYPGGLAGRAKLGLDRGGPELVITPKCVFDFDKERGRMRVKSVHPGISLDEVRDATGFDLGDLGNVPDTPAPNSEELEILRRVVDPNKMLLPDLEQ